MVASAFLILLGTIFFFKRHKKDAEEMDEEILNARINSFRPEPLIDHSTIDSGVIEIPAPDESIPGCVNLAKVNFFNFLNNQDFRKEAELCIRTYGVGSCGPRGFYGTIDIHLTLEDRIAKFMDMEETVLYSYGFTTVSSAIGAYCKKKDIIFCDEQISFAAVQGFLAARSTVVYFKHNDMNDLESKLKAYEVKEKQRGKLFCKFLIVEGIYASSGTICPLPELMSLREKYKLRIFIDESLSWGVLGAHGKGVTEHFNIDRSDVDMIIASLEYAVGSIGGFCVGASVVIEHQRLSGLGYCFSASLPPFLTQAALCALTMFETQPSIFQELHETSIIIDRKLRNLEEFIVVSDPLSPVKVFTTKRSEKRCEDIKKIHTFCTEKNIHFLPSEEYLKLNVNIATEDSAIDNVMAVLKSAVDVCI